MKFKRILALAVSLAMILSIVPAFEFTASAATSSTATLNRTITYNTSGTKVEYRDGTTDNVDSSRDIYVNHSGWAQRLGLASFNMPTFDESQSVAKATLRLYANAIAASGRVTIGSASNDWTEDSYTATSTLQIPDYQATSSVTTIPSYFTEIAEQTVSTANTWYEFDVTDYVKNFASGEEISFVATHVTKSGEANGSTAVNLAFAGRTKDNAPQLVIDFATSAPVTVKYVTASGSELATRTETGFVGEDFTVTNTTNDNYIVIDKDGDSDGYLAVLLNSETKTVESTGTTVTVTVKPVYAIKSENLYPNSEDEIDNWTLGNGGTIGSHASIDSGDIVKSTDNPRNGKYSAKTTVGWTSADGGGWKGSNKAIVMFADVNANSKYYFAGAYYPGSSNGTEMTIGTVSTAGDITSVQGVVAGNKNLSNGGITSFNGTDTSGGAGNGKFYASCNGKYNQMEQVVTTDDDSVQFVAAFYWLCDSGTSYFDDFMLYEIEDYVEETKSSYDFKDAVSVRLSQSQTLRFPKKLRLKAARLQA
jgi:hypothetical protein